MKTMENHEQLERALYRYAWIILRGVLGHLDGGGIMSRTQRLHEAFKANGYVEVNDPLLALEFVDYLLDREIPFYLRGCNYEGRPEFALDFVAKEDS